MKKTNKILLLITTLVVLPIGVKADMGMPEIQPYDAYISNPNGVKVDCDDISKIDVNEKVKVTVDDGEDVEIEYKGCTDYISIKDIKPLIDVYNPLEHSKEVDKLNSPKKVKIANKNGITLYSGPSSAFKQITNIPYNTELTYLYSSGTDNGLKPVWLYVEYQGVFGWISTKALPYRDLYEECEVLFKFNAELPILFDTTLETIDGKKITVPKGTIINNGFMNLDAFGSEFLSYYADYNNTFGSLYLSYNFVPENKLAKIKLLKNVDMYDSLKYEASGEDDDSFVTVTDKKISTIPKDTILTYYIYEFEGNLGDKLAYVNYDGKDGWIHINDRNSEYLESINKPKIQEINENSTTKSTNDEVTKKTKKLSIEEIICLCLGGAVVISLTGLVTMILINKKKDRTVQKNIENEK